MSIEAYYKDNYITEYQGHVLDVLRQMPAESVHLVITSPPYFGLRCYDIEPQVWPCGCDVDHSEGCEHEWGEIIKEKVDETGFDRNRRGLNKAAEIADGNPRLATTDNPPVRKESQFCRKCDAWRGDLGNESTIDLYLNHLVSIFREVKRVLRNDGVMFLNIADSFASGKGSCFNPGGGEHSLGKEKKELGVHPLHRGNISDLRKSGLKPKDLCGIPWSLAFALRDDGWWLRSDIIWQKLSCMPESLNGWRWERCRVKVKAQEKGKQLRRQAVGGRDAVDGVFLGNAEYQDCPGCPKCDHNDGYVLRKGSWRPTSSHEYVFMLAKSEKYFCDGEAVRETINSSSIKRWGGDNQKRINPKSGESVKGESTCGFNSAGRNLRSVWTINPEPTLQSHFASFPSKLCEIAIKAGTSQVGCCSKCQAPYVRVIEKGPLKEHPDRQNRTARNKADFNGQDYAVRDSTLGLVAESKTIGWRPSCQHKDLKPVPCVVLDIFSGSGRALTTARRLGRKAIGIDLKREYLEMPLDELRRLDRWERKSFRM